MPHIIRRSSTTVAPTPRISLCLGGLNNAPTEPILTVDVPIKEHLLLAAGFPTQETTAVSNLVSMAATTPARTPDRTGGHSRTPPSSVQLLSFILGELRIGLPVTCVREVARAVAIAALPKAPPIIEGVINVRGELAPVLDVRQRFQLPAAPLHPDQHFIVAWAGQRLVALRVDRVTDVITVDESEIEPVSRAAPGAEYARGVAKLADGLLVIHDLETFLALDEGRQVDLALGR